MSLKYFNFAWFYLRVFFGFLLFGILASIGSVVLPLLALLYLRRQTEFQIFIHRVIRLSFAFVLGYSQFVRVIKINFNNKSGERLENIRIFVCNHVSLFDVLIFIAFIPNCYTFVKDKFSNHPIMRAIIIRSGFVSVNVLDPVQCGEAFKLAVNLVKTGSPFVIFPEGTRSKTGKLGPFQKGVFRLAFETEADVHPVIIKCSEPILNNSKLMPTRHTVVFDVDIYPRIVTPKKADQKRNSLVVYSDTLRRFFEEKCSNLNYLSGTL